MRKRRQEEGSAVKSDINVTPLVDVCLVLLIIFMVVTPMLSKSKVALPETQHPEALPERTGQITISVGANGAISIVGERRVEPTVLTAVLRETHARSPEREVVVKGDRRLRYGEVREVLKRVNEAGFGHAGLAADRKKL